MSPLHEIPTRAHLQGMDPALLAPIEGVKERRVTRYFFGGRGYNSLRALCQATATRRIKAEWRAEMDKEEAEYFDANSHVEYCPFMDAEARELNEGTPPFDRKARLKEYLVARYGSYDEDGDVPCTSSYMTNRDNLAKFLYEQMKASSPISEHVKTEGGE